MSWIFLDESGDLGFNFRKKHTSNYFVISFLFVKDKSPVEKIVKKIFQGFTKKEVKSHSGTLHCYKEKTSTRKKLLTKLVEKDISILNIYLNKHKVFTGLQEKNHTLYNYVTNILLDRLYTKKLVPLSEKIILVASRRETNKFLNENFKTYLESQMINQRKLRFEVEIKTPKEEKCLQIVDFVSWSTYRKYEHKDPNYWEIISTKIVEENGLFK